MAEPNQSEGNGDSLIADFFRELSSTEHVPDNSPTEVDLADIFDHPNFDPVDMEMTPPTKAIPLLVPEDVSPEDETEEGKLKRAYKLFQGSIKLTHPLEWSSLNLRETPEHLKVRL